MQPRSAVFRDLARQWQEHPPVGLHHRHQRSRKHVKEVGIESSVGSNLGGKI